MMGATSDITSRKEGAQALLDSRLRLEQVLEVGNMAVGDCELASGKLTINSNLCGLLGRDLAELEN